jgi:hypothetical protein
VYAGQDAAVRARVLAWWAVRVAGATAAERTAWRDQLATDAANTQARLQVAGPFDPTKTRFRTQLQGEVADLAAWQQVLDDAPPAPLPRATGGAAVQH